MKVLVKFGSPPRRYQVCRPEPRPGAKRQEQRDTRGAGNAGHLPPKARIHQLLRLGCTVQQREPRRPARMRDEQSAVLTKTGQLIVLINIRVSAETRAPIALVQLPLGLNLPAGAKFEVDDGRTSDLQIQTCEARGCYANLQISPDVLAALKSGKQLKRLGPVWPRRPYPSRCRPRLRRGISEDQVGRRSPRHCPHKESSPRRRGASTPRSMASITASLDTGLLRSSRNGRWRRAMTTV